jgi:ABC-type phosphate/phosphonate transport system substrate-binding protein
MYAPHPAAASAWAALFAAVSRRAGVALTLLDHPPPAPLEELWRREDLGLAFICGYPFALGDFRVQPVAAPIPASPLGAGRPLYASALVTRAEAPFRRLEDVFGQRVGWTVAHSQSGFNALRHHLLRHRGEGGLLFRASIGGLQTPRRVIQAVLAGEIELGPVDSYVFDLLARHEPETIARLRVLAITEPTPMPLLVASEGIAEAQVAALRSALLAFGETPDDRTLLAELCLDGFAAVSPADYVPLLEQAVAAQAAGYPVPA